MPAAGGSPYEQMSNIISITLGPGVILNVFHMDSLLLGFKNNSMLLLSDSMWVHFSCFQEQPLLKFCHK